MPLTAEEAGVPNEAAAYLKSLEDPEVVERVRCTIPDAHVFKLPTRQTAGGWRGADWDQEVWQGTLKVVERGDLTVILLVDRANGSIFAVCPVKDGAVDRCIDSSRYFVLRVENASTGRHMFIGMAFNERNDAFDFNTALEDSRREREAAKNPVKVDYGPPKDYSMKEGQKIHINVNKVSTNKKKKDKEDSDHDSSAANKSNKSKPDAKKPAAGLFLKPNKRDTPRRAGDE